MDENKIAQYEPLPRWGHISVTIGNKAYMWGGRTEDFSDAQKKKVCVCVCVCVHDTVVYMYVADNYFIVFQMCTVKYDIISGVEYVHSLYHKYFVYIIIIKNVKFPQSIILYDIRECIILICLSYHRV